ncbi:MAG: hypothetical protein EAS52_13885 [Parapedobacter sp.]|nr:MAG: hypothetical protein EAS52_13885 [Parapedobacter sp.]
MFAASKKQLDSETLEAVWQAVLLGDEKATERLVESMEIYILAVAKLYWNRPFPSKMCCMPGDTLYLTY